MKHIVEDQEKYQIKWGNKLQFSMGEIMLKATHIDQPWNATTIKENRIDHIY